ncbi:MFS transporter [Bacillaceae bacterium Marseille-Q3522]|nr:MFS transporter [Bacillaceae bacterium Marseille-Q3522]
MGHTFAVQKNKQGTNRPLVLVSIMLATFMGAIEATIISTAMPAIVADLGEFSLYSWIFSAYLLMNTVTVLIYGKLADLFGRKPILTIGVLVFLIGSLLCGFANSMKMLVVFRLIQGLGAGAVIPISTTIVGDIYSVEERAKIQGYLASVWGISAIVGPALGGLIVEYISWPFVFWINIPLGILSLIGIWLFLFEKVEKKKHKIDYAGTFFITVSISSFMYLLVEGGTRWSWMSLPAIGLLLISVCTFLLFIFQEKKAKEPMMPFSIWKNRSIFIANIASLTTGVMLIGISSYLPAFVQGVMEQSTIVAGFTLTSMSIGWPIASTIAGRILLKIGYRNTALLGGLSLLFGSILFVVLSADSGPLLAVAGSFFIGVGMGLTGTAFIVLIQNSVTWQQRGVATAANMFMRNLGNTVGAAFLGSLLNNQFLLYMKDKVQEGQHFTVDSANMLLDENSRNGLTGQVKLLLQGGLTYSLHFVYLAVFLSAIVSFLLVFFLPRSKKT